MSAMVEQRALSQQQIIQAFPVALQFGPFPTLLTTPNEIVTFSDIMVIFTRYL